MKLAFSILSHKEPDILFEKLLARLNEFPDSYIVIHHDFNQSSFPDALIAKYKLHMIRPNHSTQWGHISKIPALLDTFVQIKNTVPDFDWLISVSPNCYPIKSTAEILNFFQNATYDYFMESHPMGLQYGGVYKWHYQALFSKRIGKIPFLSKKGKFYWRHIRVPINRNKTPFNNLLYPYAGSDWYFLNRKTIDRVLQADLGNHPMAYYMAKANTAPDKNSSPVEVIVQTFIRNQTDLIGSNNYYRYIDWTNATSWHPNILTLAHWEIIKNSNALFARKFDWPTSSELIKLIDDELLEKSKSIPPQIL